MRYTREALALASLTIGILTNGLLFSIGFWRDYNIIQAMLIWGFASGMIAYCTYRFLKAVAQGKEKENE